MRAIEFLRDVGKHFSVNVMLDRDTVRRRLEGEGISYTEFSYMLLQANDYVELHQRYGCTLQIGGSDQWGNIIAGVRLVRQKAGRDGSCADHAVGDRFRGQQVRKVDGRRQPVAGPGDDEPVRLVPVLLQYRRRRRDPVPEVVHVPVARRPGRTRAGHHGTAHTSGPPSAGSRRSSPHWSTGRRSALPSNTPARRCSGAAELAATRRADAGRRAAGGRNNQVAELTPDGPNGITDLLVASGLVDSKGAARRTVAEGGAYVNNVRVESDDWTPQPSDFLHDRWLVLRRGKRNIAGVVRVG